MPRAPEFPERLDAPEEVETPGVTTIEALAELLGIDAAATSKAMPVDEGRRHGRARARPRRRPARGGEARRGARRPTSGPATEEEIRAAFGADPGSIGPVGFDGEVVADETLREGQFVAGANRTGWHLRGVEHGRDFEARFADLREPREGDRCPSAAARSRFQTAIEVGHIFKLGTRYSAPLDATFLDEDGTEKPLVMGSYGIGPGRIMAAAVEQRHDEQRASCWPAAIAPYDVHVVVAARAPRSRREEAARVARRAPAATCCSTTATCAPGEKFADADLIGLPMRVTVGKKTLEDGMVDVRDRASGDETAGSRCGDLAKGGLDGEATAGSARSRSAPTIERLMNETGDDLPGARREDRPLGRLPQPPRPRQPPGAVERGRSSASRRRSASSPSTSASTACA